MCTSAAEEFSKGLPGIGAAGCQTCIETGVIEFSVLCPNHMTTQPPLSSFFWFDPVMKRQECFANQLRHFSISICWKRFFRWKWLSIDISVDNALNGPNLFHFSLSSSKSEADRMRVWGILHPGHSLVQWDRRMPGWIRWEKLWKR